MTEIQGEEVPDAESLAYEAAAVLAVTGVLSGAVAALLASVVVAWDLATLPADRAAFGRMLAARIRFLRVPPMARRLHRVASEGRDLGQAHAIRRTPPGPLRDLAERADWRETDWATPVVPDIDNPVRAGLHQAAFMAESLPFERKADLHAVMGKLRQTVARAEGSARYTANEGINAGAATVAHAQGLNLIWVAERNACLDCLAHAGWVVEPNGWFPPGLSFDPLRAGIVRAVRWAPLHPNCRCQVRSYDGPVGAPNVDRSRVDPAARLAAEARRSTVYQWTDYGSGAARRRAAEALLQAGADLPRTVERRARQALRRGGVRRPR